MSVRGVFITGFVTALLATSCRDATGPHCTSPPAYTLTIMRPTQAKATLIWNRHGDDSLHVEVIASTGTPLTFGNGAGIYDYRVITAGYHDWITTNMVLREENCVGAHPPSSQIWMQPGP